MHAFSQITSRRSGVAVLHLLLALMLLAAMPAFSQSLPALTGRIVDNAGMIDATTRQTLTDTLASFEAKSSDQIVVATVPDLGGEAIEPYANRLFRYWQLGQTGENNGVLLLVSRDDRQMRIEVGYGLEGTLTDLHSSLIIENTMIPAFRDNDFAGGIAKAVDDIIMVLEGNSAELEARAKRDQTRKAGSDWSDILFISLFVMLFGGAFGFALFARIFGRRLGPGRYKWLGIEIEYNGGGGSSASGGGRSSSGGGFSGGGGSSGGGGASGRW